MTNKKILLIIGRYQPFHLGHLKIIEKYHKKGYFIKIGIGSSQFSKEFRNPFNAKERKDMILLALKEAKIKDYQIYYIPDIPSDDIYVDFVKKIVGEFDVTYTGNSWVKRLFLEYKKKSYEIHYFNERIERINNISASKIRKRWLSKKSRKDLPWVVYNYLKKINAEKRLKKIKNTN